MPEINGCICQVCAEDGLECTNIAPDGEDECIECGMGIHERERREGEVVGG